MTDGYAFSFCSHRFLKSVAEVSVRGDDSSNEGLLNAFKFLARCQKAAWSINNDETKEKVEQSKGDDFRNEYVTSIDIFGNQTSNDFAASENITNTENSVSSSLPVKTAEPDDTLGDGIAINIHNYLSKGKLNRSKFLSAIRESFSCDLCGDYVDDSIIYEGENVLLQRDKCNLLSKIMSALAKGHGDDFTICEGNDPFHNFAIRDHTYSNDEMEMALQMPHRTPDRLTLMVEHCLGRKRLPGYDNSDPFLTPVPSVLPSRKMHGSTLPIVRRSRVSVDPILYKEEEWS